MGLLTYGEPLSWEETRKYAEHVRKHGIFQFIKAYNRLKTRQDEELKWGDEVEYMLVKFDHEQRKARLHLKAEEILKEMQEKEEREKNNPFSNLTSLWRPEFGAFMVEGTPGTPYGDLCKDFAKVEENMKIRRREVEALLGKNESLLCLTSFPRMGTPSFTWPEYQLDPKNSPTGSIFFPDEAIYGGHPRFRTLAKNIRQRRKRRVIINIPVHIDENTPQPFKENFEDEEAKIGAKEDNIYMDHMGFGMGCSCLQVTFQASNMEEARNLYDQLTPMCPILLALSAASPIFRGLLSGYDCRWSVIAQSVDDRTREELGEEPLNMCKFRINKSRYDSVDSYISEAGERYNDISLVYDQKYYQEMLDGNVDPIIARHIAHLFIRDPITLYKQKLVQNDEEEMDHFENIQSTNWQTMRFKPPPPSEASIGWRVEFRPMELQITEFENAAFVVDENMKNAQKENAVNNCKFWFRNNISPRNEGCEDFLGKSFPSCNRETDGVSTSLLKSELKEDYLTLMSIDEIINGKPGRFPGLRFFIDKYLLDSQMEAGARCSISQYLNLISGKASGEIVTTAKWIRDFVRAHPEYKKDSTVSDEINYDLLKEIDAITKGKPCHQRLLPECLFKKTKDSSSRGDRKG